MNYKTDEIDFSPFNADEVLKALCSVLRTSKHLSFSYAGDIQSVIDRIGRVFYAGRSLIFVNSKDDASQVEIFEYVKGQEAASHHFASPYGQKLAAHLISLPQEIYVIEDKKAFCENLDETFRDLFLRIFENFGAERIYLVPMRLRSGDTSERRAGLLALQEAPGSPKWNKLVLESLISISDHLAKLAEVEHLHSRLELYDKEDPATGFLNRRGGLVALNEELERARYFKDKLSIVLVDLDKHLKGEQLSTSQTKAVISTVSGVLASQSRSVDVVSRFAQDQFLVCIPRLDPSEVVGVAEHIKAGIHNSLQNLNASLKRNLEEPLDARSPLTASVGVASMPEDGGSFDELFAAANERVLACRSLGGNRVKAK